MKLQQKKNGLNRIQIAAKFCTLIIIFNFANAKSNAADLIAGIASEAPKKDLCDTKKFSLCNTQWYHEQLSTPLAWELTKNNVPIQVLVCDSAVDGNNPALQGAVIGGYDFIDKKSEVTLSNNPHGTSIAGMIAGRGVYGQGFRGVNPTAQIISGVIAKGKGGTRSTTQNIVDCIQWAIDHKIRIVNLSYYVLNSDSIEVLLRAKKLHEAGGMVFVPAGNSTPPNYDVNTSDIVVVGATDPNDWPSLFSVHGKFVDLSAPGNAILSLDLDGKFAVGRGTSKSTAFVSGAASLLLSMNPNGNIDEILQILRSTAKDAGTPGRDDCFGHGRINIGQAVQTYLKQIPPK